MKDGEIVEKNSTLEIFKNPQTVYTKNLISARKQQIGSEIKNYSDKVILEVKDLDFFYDKSSFRSQKFHALKNINFQIIENEIVGLIGESGSGKTTLSDVLSFLKKSTMEKISFLGKEIKKLQGSKLKEFQTKSSIYLPRNSICF